MKYKKERGEVMRNTVLLLPLFGLLLSPAWAGGVSLNYSEVLVENLQPGVSYSMSRVVNLPVRVANNTETPLKMKLSVAVPEPRGLKKGFVPVPTTSWITLEKSQLELPPKTTAESDLTISIPDDPQFLGKKYQINIIAAADHEDSKGPVYAMSLVGRLLVTVAPEKQSVNLKASDVNFAFDVVPDRVEMDDVPLGETIEVLTKEQKPVVIRNLGAKKAVFKLENIDPATSVLAIEEGFEATPDPDMLVLPTEEMVIGPGKEKSLELKAEIPDQEEFKGKKLFFIFAVTTGSGKVTQGKRYVRVLISTKKE